MCRQCAAVVVALGKGVEKGWRHGHGGLRFSVVPEGNRSSWGQGFERLVVFRLSGSSPLDVSTKWWRHVAKYPWLAYNKRLKFGNGQGAAPFQSAMVYLGNRIEQFHNVFDKDGFIYSTPF